MNSIPDLPFPFCSLPKPGWQTVLADELHKSYIADLAAFVRQEYATSPLPIYPPRELIFNAFNLTSYDRVNVLLIGQDPYHGPGQAHGLSFSVPENMPLPPSLRNIYKELRHSGFSTPSNGCLTSWARSGVMLLNATLTVAEGKPLSHRNRGWERFTDAVVSKLVEREDPVIFVLWGKSAQEKCRFLSEGRPGFRHYVLTAAHPSPFSAHRGFFGCNHFVTINELLIAQGKIPISWDNSDTVDETRME